MTDVAMPEPMRDRLGQSDADRVIIYAQGVFIYESGNTVEKVISTRCCR